MGPVDFSGISVLTVEDDVSGRALIGTMLRRLGIEVHSDATGLQAVEMALSISPPPAIIFLDLNLPQTSGFEVIGQLRAEPRLAAVRVVATTAMDPQAAIPRCREAGFDGFIAKPLRRSLFRQQVEDILSGRPVWDTGTGG